MIHSKHLIVFLVAQLIMVTQLAFGADESSFLLSLGFTAPPINSTDVVTYPEKGDIIFNTANSTFYGYNGTSWAAFSTGASAAKVVSAKLTVSAGTYSLAQEEGGDWLAASPINEVGTGDTELIYNSGFFTNAPICVVSSNDPAASFNAAITSVDTVNRKIRVRTANGGETAVADVGFNIICVAI